MRGPPGSRSPLAVPPAVAQCMPVDARASCLYQQRPRIDQTHGRLRQLCDVRSPGQCRRLASANLHSQDSVVPRRRQQPSSPACAPAGDRAAARRGTTVVETTMRYGTSRRGGIFSTGNYSGSTGVRIERSQPGNSMQGARALLGVRARITRGLGGRNPPNDGWPARGWHFVSDFLLMWLRGHSGGVRYTMRQM